MSKRVQWLDGAGLGRFETMYTSLKDGTLPQTDTSSLIEPSDRPISTSLPNHKNALQRVTNYKQEQPIDIDPNTILHNSLVTTKIYIYLKGGF
jgi:hypothetical protein